MAYQYDEMGNVIGQYESEEERRRREQANQPVKQTITYNPDGTSEVTIKGTPESLSSANPNTPTVSGPVSPEETYQRMLQAESGNRDYTASGQPVTSSKGAMFASQVMPATAANPGYGVRPATSQTPEEYNRVGREYFQALVKRFGGDTQKAAAAYNAGPGRVQQNIQQNQGQMNVAQLPKETQGYLQKIGQTVSNMIPSAQASTLPQGPVNPATMAAPAPARAPASTFQGQTNEFGGMEEPARQSMYSLGTGQPQQGLRAPQPAPAMVPDTSMYIQQYVGMQDDPQKLIQYGFNETVPEPLRNRAKNRAAELIQQQQGQQEAQQRLATMTETDLAKALREKTTGGSYLKAALFGLLGMEQSAMAEAAKLGVGKETSVMLTDGTPAMIKVAANGTPISGYNATTGKKLTSQELISAQAGSASKLNIVGGTFINDQTGEVGRAITDERTGVSYIQTDKGRKPMTGFRPQSSAGSLTDQRSKLVQEINLRLQGKTEEEKMAILRPYNQQLTASGYPAISPQEVGISAPQIQAPATATTPTNVPSGAPVSTTPAPSAPATGKRPTGPELEARKDIITDAAKQVAASADTQNTLNSINKVTALIDSKEHNIGSALSAFAGRGPVAQAIGRQFETTDAKNTKTIMDTVQKLAADGLKTLGSNPSTIDLEFWTKFKPDASSDPAYVKDWIQSRSEDLKRRLGYATSQVGAGGGAGTAPSVSNAPLGTAQNPIKLK